MGWFSDITDAISDVGDSVYDFLTGEAAEEAANAAADSQEAQAEAYRTQAKETRSEGVTALENYVKDSNQTLSSVVNKVAAAGGIGFKQTETVTEGSTGVDVGSEDSQAVKDLKSELTTALGDYKTVEELTAEQEKYQTIVDTETKSEQDAGIDIVTEAETALAKITGTANKVKSIQSALDKIEGAGTESDLTEVSDVSETQSTAAKYATGSNLANINTFRDELQQARNTYARGIQSDVYSLLTSAETYDAAAASTRKVGEISQWDTILGRGLQIVGIGLNKK